DVANSAPPTTLPKELPAMTPPLRIMGASLQPPCCACDPPAPGPCRPCASGPVCPSCACGPCAPHPVATLSFCPLPELDRLPALGASPKPGRAPPVLEAPARRKSFVDLTAAPCFGHAPDYSWVSGQVEYSRVRKEWRLRYASADE